MKKDKPFWIKSFSVFLIAMSWIVFFVMKNNNPDLSLTFPIIIAIFVSLMGAFFFFKNMNTKKNPKEKQTEIPSPIGKEEREEMLKKVAHEKFRNNVKIDGGIINIKDKTINKNHIYAYRVRLNLDDEEFIGIINANFPSRDVTILDKDTSDYNIEKEMNSKSENPFQEPDVKQVERRLDEFNRPVEKVVETKHKEKKDEEKEDLV